ncbi:hypothetical protein DPEC_G00169800 [Dallia pectoralis]|uniref:Uncharacterized protein n=1 Tax=Dallia pectoralis TaxID=75939 RepID=A0ACC2GD47_DALPE|nr:hypothetical protein DPEC_G00169800 [Dallia pectoralis]
MKILQKLLLLTFMTGCVESFKVIGYTGGTVTVYCHYSEEQKNKDKYFCKGTYGVSCEDKIRTNTWKHKDRFSLYDNTVENYFTVVIRQLTREDKGTYWCGVDISGSRDSYTIVELEVEEDEICKTLITATANLGGEANIICKYPDVHKNSSKYFCKEDSESDCKYLISDKSRLKEGRFSLTDNKVDKSFRVAISDLAEEDTGTYWCGVENRTTKDGYITLINQVNLHVIKSTTTSLTPQATVTSPQGTFKSRAPSSSSSLLPPSSSMPSLEQKKSDLLAVVLVVILVVLLMVVGLLIVYRWKHNKKTESVSSAQRVNTNTGNNNTECCHGDGDYEEIKERLYTSDAADVTTAIKTNLPRNLSDSLHNNRGCPNEAITTIIEEGTSSCYYATVNFGDSLIYSTVNHPQTSSDASTIYSTVCKPKDT